VESLNYSNIIGALFRAMPEAKTAYDTWDMPGEALPYIVFGFLEESFFTPIVTSSTHAELRTRIFEFLEQMAASDHTEVKNLLWIGLFEAWAANGTIATSLEHMGPQTKSLAKKAISSIEPHRVLGRD
jgi:hypothetical protein